LVVAATAKTPEPHDVEPVIVGVGKFRTGIRHVAAAMKSCQIAAGIVPPYTGA
jgi:hypothetical protein